MEMESLEKRLRKLRIERKMTQEDLAQQLHVTRQAVSNWENGKTAVGIEYLVKLSEIYGVSVDEILRGERAAEPEEYPRMQRKYKVVLIVCGVILVIGSLLMLFLDSWLRALMMRTYKAVYAVAWAMHSRLVPAVMAAASGVAVAAAASLGVDIRLWGRWKQLALAGGVLCLLLFALSVCFYYGGAPLGTTSLLLRVSTGIQEIWMNRAFLKELFFLSGMCFFLGLNR